MLRRAAAVLLLAAVSGRAQDRTCDLAGDFHIRTDAVPNGMKALSAQQTCVVYDDLAYLHDMRIDPPGRALKWMFLLSGDPSKTGQELLAWVVRRIQSLSVGSVADAEAANLGLARRTGQYSDDAPPGTIVLTDAFFGDSRIRQLETLVHEARHSDGDYHLSNHLVDEDHPDTAHGHCRTARLAGGPPPRGSVSDWGCDPNVLGAYGYGAVFMFNVAKSCAGCTDSDKQEAQRIGYSDYNMHLLEVEDPPPL